MNPKHKIESFSAGCATCKETIEMVRKIAGADHEIQIHEMHQHEIASRAKQHGVRSLPAVVIGSTCSSGQCPAQHPASLPTALRMIPPEIPKQRKPAQNF